MALWAGGLVVAAARRARVSLAPHPRGVGAAAKAGAPLFVRTCCLRAAGLAMLWAATSLGSVQLAAHQIVANVWLFSSLCTDALAIAGQALIGAALGARDTSELAGVKREVIRLSVYSGCALGCLFAVLAWPLPWAFTPDAEVRAAASAALVAVAACMPLAAWAFALDGILMGAGEGGFLARGMAVSLACYLPAALAVGAWVSSSWGLALLWASYAGEFMAVRALVYRRRAARVGLS
jgi:Na+-driven multidrug efflux pump